MTLIKLRFFEIIGLLGISSFSRTLYIFGFVFRNIMFGLVFQRLFNFSVIFKAPQIRLAEFAEHTGLAPQIRLIHLHTHTLSRICGAHSPNLRSYQVTRPLAEFAEPSHDLGVLEVGNNDDSEYFKHDLEFIPVKNGYKKFTVGT